MDEPRVIDEAAKRAGVTTDAAQQVVDLVDEARMSAALERAQKAVAKLDTKESGFFAFPTLHRLLGRE
jgi:hypothetical protein